MRCPESGCGLGVAWRCLWCRLGGEGSAYFRQRQVALMGWGSAPGVRCACFMPPPTYRLQRRLKKALPAVSPSGTDLRSLCSKITAQPSAAVLMDMKQSGWMAGGAHMDARARMHAQAQRQEQISTAHVRVISLWCNTTILTCHNICQHYACNSINNQKKAVVCFLMSLSFWTTLKIVFGFRCIVYEVI